MIIRPGRHKLGTVRRYVPTYKDLPYGASEKEHVHWQFAGWLVDAFGEQGATPENIYQDFTGPKGLSADTTAELLSATVADGYLKISREDT